MKFSLARRIQESIGDTCPGGWRCRREVAVLPPDLVRLLGYRPTADVLLESETSPERIWVELEISRADPVANHAKFGSAHLVLPFPPTDSFVSLVSRDVVVGRANLAAHATFMLRRLGLGAFQMALFPGIEAAHIKRMNQGLEATSALPAADVEGVIRMTRGIDERDGVRIHYAANRLEALLNLDRWNRDIGDPECRNAWGTRRVRYFVYDAALGRFAPSKFCAYTRMSSLPAQRVGAAFPLMDIPFYATIDQNEKIFDGNRAWKHLVSLGFQQRPLQAMPSMVQDQFKNWLARAGSTIKTTGGEVIILSSGSISTE